MDWTKGLNREQSAAVLHTYGPLLILAGAGSGKTTVLVARTGRLLAEHKARADEICVLTFTNKAARELKHRVSQRLGPRAKKLWTGTFHSFGLSLIKKYSNECGLPKQFGIVDATDSQAIIRDLLKDVAHGTKSQWDPEKLLKIINGWREHGLKRSDGEDDYEDMAEVLFTKYLDRLRILGVTDFEGLLLKPLQLFSEFPQIRATVQSQYKYLMVDEFQDTNTVQMKLIKSIVGDEQNVAVVGDDDQAIYGWRGACVSNILGFPKMYEPCTVVRLERNYRSTPRILAIANAVIEKNQKRHGKTLRPHSESDQGQKADLLVFENEDEESQNIALEIHNLKAEYALGDIAVLYRSNSQGGLLEGILRQNRIPYRLTGGTALFDRKEAKDVLAFLRSAMAPNEVSARRIINVPTRGIGDVSVGLIHDFAQSEQLPFIKAVRSWEKCGISHKTGGQIELWLNLLSELPKKILQDTTRSAGENLTDFFRGLHYYEHIRTYTKDESAAQFRWTSIEILGRILDGFVAAGGRTEKTLKDFIDSMELRDAAEDLTEDHEGKVHLMTLHACKGLEFPAVIMVGLEEDIIPHRTLGQDISEERRLFYVGVTRAMKRLILTRAQNRRRYGRMVPSSPSRFLQDLPAEHVTEYPLGGRPLRENDRQTMLADLYRRLDVRRVEQDIR